MIAAAPPRPPPPEQLAAAAQAEASGHPPTTPVLFARRLPTTIRCRHEQTWNPTHPEPLGLPFSSGQPPRATGSHRRQRRRRPHCERHRWRRAASHAPPRPTTMTTPALSAIAPLWIAAVPPPASRPPQPPQPAATAAWAAVARPALVVAAAVGMSRAAWASHRSPGLPRVRRAPC